MDMDEAMNNVIDAVESFDAINVSSEGISDEEREAIAYAVRERAKERINEDDLECKIDMWDGDVDEAVYEYSEELLSDTYQSIIQYGDSLVDKYLEESAKKKEWLRSDDLQIVKELDEYRFDLAQVENYPSPDSFVVVRSNIDLRDYSDAEIDSFIHGFGYDNLQDLKDSYGDKSNQIIAECIFESLAFNEYDFMSEPFPSEKKAEDFLRQIEKENAKTSADIRNIAASR